VTAEDLANDKIEGVERLGEEAINRFRQRVQDRLNQQRPLSARPITIEPYPADSRLRGKGRGQGRLRRASHADSPGRRPEARNGITQAPAE
jgi:hypothetical protein